VIVPTVQLCCGSSKCKCSEGSSIKTVEANNPLLDHYRVVQYVCECYHTVIEMVSTLSTSFFNVLENGLWTLIPEAWSSDTYAGNQCR
jgi:hypothetical protein